MNFRRLTDLPVGLNVQVELWGERQDAIVAERPEWILNRHHDMIPLIVPPETCAAMFSASRVFLPEPDTTPVDDMFEVVMLSVLRDPFKEWLTSLGLKLARIPSADGIPIFTTTPTDERIRNE